MMPPKADETDDILACSRILTPDGYSSNGVRHFDAGE